MKLSFTLTDGTVTVLIVWKAIILLSSLHLSCKLDI